MATGATAEGVVYPLNGDPFDVAGDMLDLVNSLQGRIIIPVANATARDALRAAIAWTPTANNRLKVERGDTGAIEANNGTTWVTIASPLDDTGWTTPTLGGGWSAYGAPFRAPQYRRVNGFVMLRGVAKGGGSGSSSPLFVLPSKFRPLADEPFPAAGQADLRVDSAGGVWVAAYQGTGSNGFVGLSGVRFEADGA